MTGSSSRNSKTIVDRHDHTGINDEIVVDAGATGRPKSKKELRLERKAAKKKQKADGSTTNPKEPDNGGASGVGGGGGNDDAVGAVLDKEEHARQKKLRRAELRTEQEKILRKELREEKKLRKRKKLNRELNAKGGAASKQHKKQKTTRTTDLSSGTNQGGQKPSKTKRTDTTRDEQDASMNAFRSVLYGTGGTPAVGGLTTTRLGVQYRDKVVGKGKSIREGKPVTVKYELTGGKFGAVLDSSPKFTFRPGMGEVIQGWDIGLEGMREGGRRALVVPPKAGYGGKDIGAGPGALLYFDITLLSCGR